MGLWNGSKFVFEESSWETITYIKMLWRYGFGSFKLKNYIEDMLTKFERQVSMEELRLCLNELHLLSTFTFSASTLFKIMEKPTGL